MHGLASLLLAVPFLGYVAAEVRMLVPRRQSRAERIAELERELGMLP